MLDSYEGGTVWRIPGKIAQRTTSGFVADYLRMTNASEQTVIVDTATGLEAEEGVDPSAEFLQRLETVIHIDHNGARSP